jgi:basic amino acid/polyamine antiporter, APA family
VAADQRLVRDLRRWDLVALVINAVIGAGIFGLPSRVFALAGTYAVVAYILAAATVLLIVLCFAEVGSRFSETGGPYLYARSTFGPLVGFQVGWLVWWGRIASIAALSNLFVGYTGHFFPAAAVEPWRSCVICALLVPLAVANILGIRVTTAITNTFTAAKLIPLCLFAFVGLLFINPQQYSLAPPSYGSFSQAALLLVFTFTGFEAAAIPTGEMRNPGKHLPFALLMGMGFVAFLYVMIQTVAIGTLPDLAHSERPLADASLRFLGTPGALLISVGALVSITGTQNASLFATPRLLFAMSENGQLPKMFGSTHPRFHTPAPAIAVTAVVAIGLAVLSTFISALTISTVVRLIAYIATCAALPLLRRHSEAKPPAFRAPAGSFVAVTAVVLGLWLLSNTAANELRMSILAMLLGFGVYAVSGRRRRT